MTLKKSIARILLIEDDDGDVELIREMLYSCKSKFILESSNRLSSGLKLLEEDYFDVVLLDLGLPDSSGIDTLLKVQEKEQVPPIIVLTGLSDEELAEEAIWVGAQDYLVKGKIDDDVLYRSITYSINRRQAENAVHAAEKKFRDFLETIQLVAVMLDLDGNITFCNNYLLSLTGWSKDEVLYKNWFDLFIPEKDRDNTKSVFKAVIKDGPMLLCDYQILTRKGDLRELEWDNTLLHSPEGSVIGTASIGIDITAHRQMEAQLRQAQKMEAIGQISGGIAHDFNNILSGMMGYVTLLQMKSKEGDPARQYLNQLLSLTERAAALTRSLLAFSRKQILDIRPTNLNDIVGMVGKLLSRVIGEDIELNLKPSDKDVVVNADAGQIEQALMNLATNARDAMPEGGTLTVSTGPFEMDNHFINMHGYGKPGKYALLIVQDTGMGIDEETRKKIFEPFFTTKGADKGTGLGLAMVYGTIKQHDGYINVYSEEGKGTTFTIYLPAIEAEAAEEKTVDNIPRRGGTETILLVEDEASLRQATRSILEEFGYRVIEAEDGNDAVNKFAEHKAEIKLVLMDVIMPGKSGKEAYQEMQKIQPDAKVIFTSGHTGDMLTSKKIAEEGLHFISKPVSPRELFEKIRDVLDN